MSRPTKCRRVCRFPETLGFSAAGETMGAPVILTVDEYETIRLIDNEGYSQEECAGYMQVARTTVQQIYNAARCKIARALVGGAGIRIEGGDYTLCERAGKQCGGCGCHRRGTDCGGGECE